MEMIYYTIAAVVLYLLSDFILNSIEIRMGKRLPTPDNIQGPCPNSRVYGEPDQYCNGWLGGR